MVDVDTAKDTLVRQLAAEIGEAASLAGSALADDLVSTRLTREKQRAAPGRPGRTYWTSPTDQEPWHCLVYAHAAMMGLCSIPGNPYSQKVWPSPRYPGHCELESSAHKVDEEEDQ